MGFDSFVSFRADMPNLTLGFKADLEFLINEFILFRLS